MDDPIADDNDKLPPVLTLEDVSATTETKNDNAEESLPPSSPKSPPSSPAIKLTKAMKKMDLLPIANIHTLDISRCFIEDGTMNVLSESLVQNHSLTYLKASNNHITYVGLDYLAKAMAKNTTLIHIDLSCNDLTKTGTDHRPLEKFATNCGPWFVSLRLHNCEIYHRGWWLYIS